MSIQTIQGRLTATDPIHHGGDEQTGNVRLLRTIKIWDPEQARNVRLPLISGNAIRGQLRRRLMRDFLARVGYGAASPKLHHALFTGGLLETTAMDGPATDLAFRRRVVALLPPLGLLGTALGNEMIEGSLRVDFATPLCSETAWWLREQGYDDPRLAAPARAFRDFTFTTRRDDLRAGEASHQMIVQFEVFAPGAQFAHAFHLRHAAPEEAGALATGIALWQADPVMGGKQAAGFGRLVIEYFDPPATDAYDAHLDAKRDEIAACLDEIAARLEGKPKQGALLPDPETDAA